jgi:hypothetical protein
MKRRQQMLLLAAPLLCVVSPAYAQMLSPDRTDTIVDDVAAFERDINHASSAAQLTRKDANYLRSRSRAIRSFFNKVSRDGLSLAEAQLVRERITYLRTRYHLQGDATEIQ